MLERTKYTHKTTLQSVADRALRYGATVKLQIDFAGPLGRSIFSYFDEETLRWLARPSNDDAEIRVQKTTVAVRSHRKDGESTPYHFSIPVDADAPDWAKSLYNL